MQKKSADPPYSDTGLRQPQISYGEACTLWVQLQWIFGLLFVLLFEVAVRVRDLSNQNVVFLRTRCKDTTFPSIMIPKG